MYQAINILLSKAGILPTIQFGKRTADKAPPAQQKPMATTSEVKAEPAPVASPQQPASVQPQPAVGQSRSGAQTAAGESNAAVDSLLALLSQSSPVSRVQNVTEHSGPEMPATGINHHTASPLLEALGHSGIDARQLSAGDHGRVAVIDQLFGTISQDALLANNFKNLLSQLSLPWALLALNPEQHREQSLQPATQLLDEMASAASLFQGTQLFSQGLYRQCEDVIKALADNGHPDTGHLQTLLTSFQDYIVGLKRKSERLEQRNIEVSQGLESLQHAREQATQTLRRLCAGQQLLPFSQQFLQSIWTDLLTFYNLRKNNQDEREALEHLTADLVTVLAGGDGNLDAMIPRMTSTLALLGSYQDSVITQLINELRAEHQSQRPGNTALLDQLHTPQNKGLDQPVQPTPEAGQTLNAVTESLLSRVEPGTLCHVLNEKHDTNEEQGVLHWKFAWRSQNGQHFLFVDGSGQKAALPDRPTLSQWVEKGRIQFLEENVPSLLSRTLSKLKTKHTLTDKSFS